MYRQNERARNLLREVNISSGYKISIPIRRNGGAEGTLEFELPNHHPTNTAVTMRFVPVGQDKEVKTYSVGREELLKGVASLK